MVTTPPDHSADNTPASPPGSAFGGVAESQAHDRGYSALIGPVLQGLCGVATRFALPVIMAFVAVAVAAGWFTANQLTLDTDTTAMFDKREPFRQHYEAYVRVFPDPRGAIIAIVDANHPALAREKAQRLAGLLEDQPTRFLDVQYTAGLPFFEEHGLLFLSLAELDALSQALAEAQPLLARLVLDPNLTGLADLYRTSLEAVLDEQVGEDALARLDPLLTLLAETLERYQAGEPVYANWEALFSMTPGNTPGDTDAPATTQDPAIAGFYREIVTIYPILDTTSLRPAEQAINAIEAAKNQLADEQTSPADAVTTFLTGEPVLAQEEMETVVIGAGLAGILSLVLVTLILGVGLASISLIAAILITLITGLVITAGLATLVVGSLNLISVAFAVLFVGLAVDFAIHFGLRYRENLSVTDTKQRALRHAAGQYGVGPALLICSACTLIGFLAFLPTSYRGLAELGIISALGMAAATLCSLLLLPALLTVLPTPKARIKQSSDLIQQRPTQRFAKPISVLAFLVFIASAVLASAISFDVNPLHLRDPSSPSVQSFGKLTEDALTTPYRGQISLADATAVETLNQDITDEPTIGMALSALSFVPDDQAAKLDVLFDLGFVIGPSLAPLASQWVPSAPGDIERALENFARSLERSPTMSPASLRLLAAINDVLDDPDQTTAPARYQALDRLVGTYLHALLARLKTALDSEGVTLTDLPPALAQDWRGPAGEFRMDILPATPITENEDLALFAEAIARVAPGATGTPDILTGASRAVALAFGIATLITLAGILLLLLVIKRRIADVLLSLLPLVLAASMTIAIAVLIGKPFNFANVIALPLLFALGVCSAVHMVWRQRQVQHGGPESLETAMSVEDTTTPKAIILSALTTLASFGSLAISPHPGTASMGLFLMIAIAATLLTTLVFLPALMSWWQSQQARKRRAVREAQP